jgi:hypothetical protein
MSREWSGILAYLNQDTGDGRRMEGIHWDDSQLPWPLTFALEEGGHEAPVVAQIDRVWIDGDVFRGEGVFHEDSENAEIAAFSKRAIELVEEGVVGISIELDEESAEMRVKKETWDEWRAQEEAMLEEEPSPPKEPEVKGDRVVIDRWASDDWLEVLVDARFRGAAIVHTPAFADAAIEVAAVAAAISLGTRSAFANPGFGLDGTEDPRLVWQERQRPEETSGWAAPITITEDGEIFGHAWRFGQCHGSFHDRCLNPPAEDRTLDRWLVGEAIRGVRTGPLYNGGTHGVDHRGRVKDHEWLAKTSQAVADVTAGFDSHGMWIAGRLRPGLSERELAEVKGSGVSVEWHPYGNRLMVEGCLFVNGPAYNVRRQAVAAAGGVITMSPSCGDCGGPTLEDEVAMLKRLVGQMMVESVRR